MAFFGWATYPIVCLVVPAVFFLGMAGRFGDALQRKRTGARQRLLRWNLLLAALKVGIFKVAIHNREIMGMVRWKRVLLRGLLLLAVGINVVSCFIALDTAADMLLQLHGGSGSSAAASSACAVVAVTVHLRIVWMAVFGV